MSVLLPFKFPVITGCDEFSSRVKELRLDRSKMMQTTFLSADFGDAYTETGISSLQASIRLIGEKIGVDYHEIDLMVKLVNLVFSNCYFFTPFGLYKQTRGMPMGDYSSRDSLDLHLVKSEYEILLELSKLSSSIHLYCRLVDDISVIIQGDFSTVRLVLQKMSLCYPQMPLNIQISFGYSRYLDLHMYNMEFEDQEFYSPSTVLACKDISSFTYTPIYSNIHKSYKHAVVSSFLHRIHGRNSLLGDVNNHLNFMNSILKHRYQDPVEIKKRIKKYFSKKPKLNLKNHNRTALKSNIVSY